MTFITPESIAVLEGMLDAMVHQERYSTPEEREAIQAALSALDKLGRFEKLLRKTVAKYDRGDNGKCAVCRIGHRLYNLKGKIGVCEWRECLSHEWREALEGNDER